MKIEIEKCQAGVLLDVRDWVRDLLDLGWRWEITAPNRIVLYPKEGEPGQFSISGKPEELVWVFSLLQERIKSGK
jgi:hypothetical protein